MTAPSGRVRLLERPGGLEIAIAPLPTIGLRVVLPIWLAGWTIGEVAAVLTLFSGVFGGPEVMEGPTAFLLLWLVMWTATGGFVWFVGLYNWWGREVIRFSDEALEVRRQLFGRARVRRFERLRVSGLRFSPHVFSFNSGAHSMQLFGLGPGSIGFDYDGETYRFGSGLQEDQSEWLIDEIRKRIAVPPRQRR